MPVFPEPVGAETTCNISMLGLGVKDLSLSIKVKVHTPLSFKKCYTLNELGNFYVYTQALWRTRQAIKTVCNLLYFLLI